MREVQNRRDRRRLSVVACLAVIVLFPRLASAQGFIGISYGYDFGGDAGCQSATNCQDKNWNWGGSLGSLGNIFGFEMEFTHAGQFTGDRPNPASVTTLMGDVMVGPKIAFVQPFGVIGAGAIKTSASGSDDSQTQIGWSIGGGLIVYPAKHVGLKGDVRYYHSFQTLSLLGIDLANNQNKVDFGRAGFGVVLKF